MIEIVFTLDYEIYGNGRGSLRELVYEPTRQLISVFKEWNATFVVFVEAAEFEKIEEYDADDAISDVRTQLQQLHDEGFEIGLHLHPQWCNARRNNGSWLLDSTEYNLCTLSGERVDHIVGRSIEYLRHAMGAPDFAPLSFRAGNWLLQPAKTVTPVLSKHGIRIDSSVFKGGRQRDHSLDYRRALENGYFWFFADDVNLPDPEGMLLEIPIHTEMLPFWKMISGKRLGVQKRNVAAGTGGSTLSRLLDLAHLSYPRKLDFCRMTFGELQSVMDRIIREDRRTPHFYKPIVAIGHSKDLVDFDTVERFLSYLGPKGIAVTNFQGVLRKLQHEYLKSDVGEINEGMPRVDS